MLRRCRAESSVIQRFLHDRCGLQPSLFLGLGTQRRPYQVGDDACR